MRLIDADALDVNEIPCFYSDECYIEDVQKWIDSAPTVEQKRGEWISVKERLPESIINKVIVYCENGYVGYGHYEKCDGKEIWYNLENSKPFSYWGEDYVVTHWMPLPEQPQEDKPEEEGDAE